MKLWPAGVAMGATAIAAGALWASRKGADAGVDTKPMATENGWTFLNPEGMRRLPPGEQCLPSEMRVTIGTVDLTDLVPGEPAKVEISRLCIDLSSINEEHPDQTA